METSVKYGHLTTIYGLSKSFGGSLSALGFTDPNIYLQTLSFPDENDKSYLKVRNASNLVFQIWPKLNFEANKEYQKLKKSQKLMKQAAGSEGLASSSDLELLAQRLAKMERRKQDEIESNNALLESYQNMDVTYGSELQLQHMDSNTFLNGKILCSDTDKSAYKFELSDEYGTGMIFKISPRYKLRQDGEVVQYKDQVVFYNLKLHSFMNFSSEHPIEIDRPLSLPQIPSLYNKPFALKGINPMNLRYEGYLSTVKDCYWQFLYHGKRNTISTNTSIHGGDLIKIRHTEHRGELAIETCFSNEFEECFLRKYQGEFPEEDTAIGSIWEVEIDRSFHRGDLVFVEPEDPKDRLIGYRLRHLLTGKLLTLHEGFLGMNKKIKVLIPGLERDGEVNSKGIVGFEATTVDNPGFCEDNGYYHLMIEGLYFYVDDRDGYRNETTGGMGVTMNRLKKGGEKMTGTMTGFNFANNEESLFTALKEKELATARFAVTCHKEKSNENAFQMIKVDAIEKQEVLFVNSTYGTLIRFINVVKAGKKELLSNELLRKVSKALTMLIFFVVKTESQNGIALDPIECEGISQVNRQKILKDMRLIELLTDILYWPFRNNFYDIKRLNEEDPEIVKIFQLSYRLIKHTIKEFRPNEIYASQWLDLFMKQTMLTNNVSNIFADVTLVELIDNNRRILEAKIKAQTINDFIALLMEQDLQGKYVKLLSALTICDGEAMVNNQAEISRMIFDTEEVQNRLVFRLEMRENCSLFIKFSDNIPFIELSKFKEYSLNEDEGRLYDYFIEFTNLLANLCLNRNYLTIYPLEKIYPFETCFQIISNNFDPELRTCFTRLILSLYIDRSPFVKLTLPSRIRIWSELDPQSNLLLTSSIDSSFIELLKGFISQFLSQLKFQGFQRAYEIALNELTQAVLVLCKNMLEFGFYRSCIELNDLLGPLFSLLNGTKDITSREEELNLKSQKFGSNSSTGLLLSKKKKRRKALGLSGTGVKRSKFRYEESETNRIVHLCKNICCEIVKFVVSLRDDMRVTQFLCEFKRVLENNQGVISPLKPGKNTSSFLKLSSPSKKSKSKLISRSNFTVQKLDEEEEAQSNNLLLILNNICESLDIDLTEAVYDPVAIYLDLLQYQNDELIAQCFELLVLSHSQRKNLVNLLRKLQILDDKSSIQALQTIRRIKASLSEFAEKTENWFGNEEDSEALKDSSLCFSLLQELNSLLKSTKEGSIPFLEEPDGEIVPRNEQMNEKDKDDSLFDCLFEKNEKPCLLNQNLVRNEGIFLKILEILRFDIETFNQQREVPGIQIRMLDSQKQILKKCYHILARFACDNVDNQLELQPYLTPIFLRHVRIVPEVNAGPLIEGLFINNKALLSDHLVFQSTVHCIIQTIDRIPLKNPLKANYMESLKVMSRYKDRIYKSNQTFLITEMCSKEFSNVFLTFSNKQELSELQEAIQNYNTMKEKSRVPVDLPAEIAYLCSLLKILAITCQEENNATESKCQTFVTTKNIIGYLSISSDCWVLRKVIMYFYFHVYLETEREMVEDRTEIDELINIVEKDLESLSDNIAVNSIAAIKTSRGIVSLRHIKLKFLITLLPCLHQIFLKKLIKDESRRTSFIQILTESLLKFSQYFDELSSKNKARLSSFLSYLSDVKIVNEDFRLRMEKEVKSQKPFKKTIILPESPIMPPPSEIQQIELAQLKINNPTLNPQAQIVQKTGILDNIKEGKLLAHLEAIESNQKFIEASENEFEHLVDYIIHISEQSDLVFEGSCIIHMSEITAALIHLISNHNKISSELIQTILTIFRKFIEMENPEKTIPAAEWENDDYEDKKGMIIKRQNQLVNLGVIKMLMDLLSSFSSPKEIKEEAILVCIALLLGGNRDAQEAFLKEMEEDRNNEFLLAFKKNLQVSFDSIKKAMGITNKKIFEGLSEQNREKRYNNSKEELEESKKPPETSLISNNEKDENKPILDVRLYEEDIKELIFIKRSFRLLQLFCEGHYQKLQDFLREQTFRGVKSGRSFDFIHMSALFFASYVKFVNVHCVDFGNQLLDFMIECIQGPSLSNQLSFCKSKTIDVCKDFLAKFQRKIDFSRGAFFSDDEQESINNVVTKSSKLLFSLIEGPANEEILKMLTEGLDLVFLLQHLKEEFCDFAERVGFEIEKTVTAVSKPKKIIGSMADLTNINKLLKRGGPVPLAELDLGDLNERLPDSFDSDFMEAFNLYTLLATLSDPAINKIGGLGLKEQLENQTDPCIVKALEFFQMHCKSIEISFNGTIIRIYFPVHPICRFLSKNSRENFGNIVNRDSPNDKIKDLVNSSNSFFDEMKHLAYLQKQILVFSAKRLNMLRDLSTILAFLMNFWIVYSYSIQLDHDNFNKGVVDPSDPDIPIDKVVNYFGYTQLVTSCLMLLCWTIIYGPLILKNKWRELTKSQGMELKDEEKEILDDFISNEQDISEADTSLARKLLLYKGPEDELFLKKKWDEEENEVEFRDFGNGFTKMQYWWISLRILFSAGSFMYMVFYILVSWIGVFVSEIVYCLHLFDVINRFQTLTNVIKSVTYNSRQLMLTLLFGLTLLYIYAMIGFYFFNDTYWLNDRNECTTLFQCYISTINFGLRNGGGIGDVLSSMAYSKSNATYYAIRFFYDLIFFTSINIVFLNIIFGIIVDTFAELRQKKNKMDEDKKTVCFICGVDRYTFDRFADGFENHIERDHQMWNYIYYMYLLKTKDSTDYNGVESYVSEMLAHDDNSWFPLLTAMSLGEEKKEDIEGLITQQMKGLESQIDVLKTKVDLIDKI